MIKYIKNSLIFKISIVYQCIIQTHKIHQFDIHYIAIHNGINSSNFISTV
jgi:hypothetical protein